MSRRDENSFEGGTSEEWSGGCNLPMGLAGDVCGLQEDISPLQATEELERLPMQVRGPVTADVRVHGRSGAQARGADDRSAVGELGSEVSWLRHRSSPSAPAKSGRLALQMRLPL